MNNEWIWGYLKGAGARGSPARAEVWTELESALGEAPPEVRALYTQADGASLNGGVLLHPLVGQKGVAGVLEQSQSRKGLPPFARRGVWRLGEHGRQALFAVRRGDLEPPSGRDSPSWLAGLQKEGWVFFRWEAKQKPRFYSSLENLLAALVPPTQTEEFGEETFTRALNSVERAMAELKATAAPARKKKPSKS
jgi:hypothetical protein